MDLTQYGTAEQNLPLDEWTTVTYNLDSPDFVAKPENGATPFDRGGIDMLYINIGGSNHTDVGTFYVRNLRLQ